jgi:amino acid adenylation domain-containing protein
MVYLLTQSIGIGAERTPDQEAVRCMGKGLTYTELWSQVNSLARVLRDRGVQRGDRVGIYMNKSLESAIALYGIMQAGAAYVPLDPFAPPSRLAFVVRDCGIRHLVSKPEKQSQLEDILSETPDVEHVIGIDAEAGLTVPSISWDEVRSASSETVDAGTIEMDLAYILYTSGSTGNPKGIMHTHRSGLSFAEWAVRVYGLRPEDRLSNHAPLHFDLSTFDFFAGALAGATTVIIPEALTKFPANMSRLMESERISVWYSVPFALIQLLQRGGLPERDLSNLRWILFAGEVFPTKHLRELMQALPDIRFSNLYGPTETNVCTYYHVETIPEGDEPVPIGKVCDNADGLVVDGDSQPVAEGEVGELLIRGGVVMRGYWNQPEKTDQGFYRRPAFGFLEDIFYHTGDLVQLDADGNYRYLGRKDRQIKTRGYRVELDEIEVALLSYPHVEEAAVYPIPDGQGSNLIEAAVVARADTDLDIALLTDHISKQLPNYAMPVHIHLLQAFPRTSTGKINRRELQAQAQERVSVAK